MKTCFETTIAGLPIRLEQSEARSLNNPFRVTYGEQVSSLLPYGEAAKELGESIMHAVAIEGKLDNELPDHE